MSGRWPRHAAGWLASRPAWALLVLVAIGVLAYGSVHPPAEAASARISHLESIIKCPSCEDLSIAQSNASTAVALRQDVVQQVHAGRSDAAIEQYVVDRYGSSVLLDPPATGVDLLVWLVPVAVLVVAAVSGGTLVWRRQRHLWRRGDGDRKTDGGALAEDEALVEAALASRQKAPAQAHR